MRPQCRVPAVKITSQAVQAVLLQAPTVVQAVPEALGSIHQAHRWKIPYSLVVVVAPEVIVVAEELAAMHPMVLVLLAVAEVAEVAVLGPIVVPSDHPLEGVSDF